MLCLAWLFAWAVPTRVLAQEKSSTALGVPAQTTAQSRSPTGEVLNSPRAALRRFLELADGGDFVGAARALMPDVSDTVRAAEATRRVYEVIRRRVVIDFDSVSPLPDGNVNDAEPPLQDRVGVMYGRGGVQSRPLVLHRVTQAAAERWVLAPESVAALETAYAVLPRSWVEGRLPRPLLGAGPLGIPRWKWIWAVVAIPVVWLLTLVLALVLRRTAGAVARRTTTTWDDEIVVRLRAPVRLFLASILALPVVVLLELDANTTATAWRLLRGLTIVSVFWMLLRMIGVAQVHLARKVWASDRANAQTIVPLIGRTLRVGLGIVALLVAFSQFGYPVGTLLAGLGLGGIVVALAAQKTVENLFGSVTLAADRVFRVGDWVKFEGAEGAVERIGLRSTHVRTLDRTMVKVPNGRLADLRIESFGERDRIRFFTTLRLVYGTTAAQLRAIIRDTEALLTSHARVWPEGIAVRLVGLGEYSLDVTVNAWFATTDWAEFEVIRQNMLLAIMEVVERANTRLAMPMQVLRIEENGRGSVSAAAAPVTGPPVHPGIADR
ncbi:MAG TPA: mechanosensitive ion channel family protein [Gemmatimonadaceae bacterium]|nr:mechanosensitive ion channel family protein [Gemmatimonadaceae bacterium]